MVDLRTSTDANESSDGADANKHPLFPGHTFISTVLDVLDSKETMSGRMVGVYMQRAIMAGFFVAVFFTTYFALLARFSASGGTPLMTAIGKVLACGFFGWALVLIYYTNSELLTSNMMIISVGFYHKRISMMHALRLLALCLLGNVLGALVAAVLLRMSTLVQGDLALQMSQAVTLKLSYINGGASGMLDLLVRAALCNFCINIGMMMVYNGKIRDDFTKCVIMLVAVFVFAYLGFEHSIANTALFLIVGLHQGIDVLQALESVAITIIGNFIGGGVLIGLNFAVMNDERLDRG